MVALRSSTRSAQAASFALATAFFLAGASRIGPQDIAALMTSQPAVSDRWREHLMTSPLGTIRAASFSMPRPLGTLIPEPDTVKLARFNADPDAVKVNRSRIQSKCIGIKRC